MVRTFFFPFYRHVFFGGFRGFFSSYGFLSNVLLYNGLSRNILNDSSYHSSQDSDYIYMIVRKMIAVVMIVMIVAL